MRRIAILHFQPDGVPFCASTALVEEAEDGSVAPADIDAAVAQVWPDAKTFPGMTATAYITPSSAYGYSAKPAPGSKDGQPAVDALVISKAPAVA